MSLRFDYEKIGCEKEIEMFREQLALLEKYEKCFEESDQILKKSEELLNGNKSEDDKKWFADSNPMV